MDEFIYLFVPCFISYIIGIGAGIALSEDRSLKRKRRTDKYPR